MIKVEGKAGISATVIADSVSSVNGKRVATFELEYPRFIHAEFMTHRLFSRNAASSRAIPVKVLRELVESNPAMPIHWGKNKPGMQASEELTSWSLHDTQTAWKDASKAACYFAERMDRFGAHKQIVNRILEPFQFIKVVCTATEFENFFWLRSHEDAQPEIKELSDCMARALELSEPVILNPGEWHVPYYQGNYGNGVWKSSGYVNHNSGMQTTDCKLGGHTLEEALKISASCCAQTSFRKSDSGLEKAERIYKQLIESKPMHASPVEHAATPMPKEVTLETSGVTALNKEIGFMSGNFAGWIQHRQLLSEHSLWS